MIQAVSIQVDPIKGRSNSVAQRTRKHFPETSKKFFKKLNRYPARPSKIDGDCLAVARFALPSRSPGIYLRFFFVANEIFVFKKLAIS